MSCSGVRLVRTCMAIVVAVVVGIRDTVRAWLGTANPNKIKGQPAKKWFEFVFFWGGPKMVKCGDERSPSEMHLWTLLGSKRFEEMFGDRARESKIAASIYVYACAVVTSEISRKYAHLAAAMRRITRLCVLLTLVQYMSLAKSPSCA